MPSSYIQSPQGRELSHKQYLEIISAAETLNETSFARKVTANWLASFPGDLHFKNQYAKILLKEGHVEIAQSVIEEVIQTDPEYLEAAITRLKIARYLSEHPHQKHITNNQNIHPSIIDISDLIQWKHALQGKDYRNDHHKQVKGANHWGETLHEVTRTLEDSVRRDPLPHKLDDIEITLINLLAQKPDLPIIAIAHLRILKNKQIAGKVPVQVFNSLVEHYYHLFPHCQYCCLTHAECLMQGIDPDKAVSLLHSCVSQDITGQVATRMWGEAHPYRMLWPQQLYLRMDFPIPVRIAGYFGWNQLHPGVVEEIKINPQNLSIQNTFPEDDLTENTSSPIKLSEVGLPTSQNLIKDTELDSVLDNSPSEYSIADTQPIKKALYQQTDEILTVKMTDPVKAANSSDELYDIRKELERVGTHLKKPDLMNSDGRIPTYVILTTHQGLLNAYGKHKAGQIEKAILNLVTVIRDKRSWNAVLFYPDQGVLLPSGKVVTKPARFDDPWSLKLSLSDLDDILAKFGEMIGAVLLLGGPEVVPFHYLPNPVDDADEDVPSDNPYATKDTNYFIPDWPIGRLPDGASEDGHFILQALQEYTYFHKTSLRNANANQNHSLQRLFSWIRNSLHLNIQQRNSFGYTAAAWRDASYEVFRPIGEAKKMLVSPPLKKIKRTKNAISVNQRYWQRRLVSKYFPGNKTKAASLSTPGVYIPAAQFSYFNLHGLVNAVEWYGQSDLFNQDSDASDYPIALKPSDLGSKGQKAPWLVFSEACYGAHIFNKTLDQAMAFQFMQKGCQVYVGSTCVSYGSLNPPLSAADYLGNAFWIAIRQGFSAGESLCQAKIALAREMNHKQGYLDGEDQKTLISFVLFGDPLAHQVSTKPFAKDGYRTRFSVKYPHSSCDHDRLPPASHELTPEVTRQVKNILDRYLPGMKDAHMTLREEPVSNCQTCRYNCGKNLSTGMVVQKESNETAGYPMTSNPGKKVVILSKESDNLSKQHVQYARLTLDEQGKLVKLVVSR